MSEGEHPLVRLFLRGCERRRRGRGREESREGEASIHAVGEGGGEVAEEAASVRVAGTGDLGEEDPDGLPEGESAAITVSNAGQALSSALAGLGRTMLPELLVKDAVEDGRLEALAGPEPGRRAYWLVAPTPQWRTRKVKSLVEFLSG